MLREPKLLPNLHQLHPQHNTLFVLQKPLLQEREAEECPKFKNMQEHTEAEEWRRTFVLDTAQNHGNSLSANVCQCNIVVHVQVCF